MKFTPEFKKFIILMLLVFAFTNLASGLMIPLIESASAFNGNDVSNQDFVVGIPYGYHLPTYHSGLNENYTCPECGWIGRPGQMNTSEDGYFCPICGHKIEVQKFVSDNNGYWGWFWEDRNV